MHKNELDLLRHPKLKDAVLASEDCKGNFIKELKKNNQLDWFKKEILPITGNWLGFLDLDENDEPTVSEIVRSGKEAPSSALCQYYSQLQCRHLMSKVFFLNFFVLLNFSNFVNYVKLIISQKFQFFGKSKKIQKI